MFTSTSDIPLSAPALNAVLAFSLLVGVAVAAAEFHHLPADVQRFVERREACDHFRGEDWDGDAQRKKEILRELDRYCTGTDRQLARLRKKYANTPAVIDRLQDFEDEIEPGSAANSSTRRGH